MLRWERCLKNEEENYYAVWKYKDAYYELSGQIEKEEIVKIFKWNAV